MPLVIIGMLVFTFGFFGAHSVASSWVGRRARGANALASALYLFFYYLGSSLVGWTAGLAWGRWEWTGVVSVLLALLGLAMLIAAFEAAGLSYFEDFFDLSGNWPEWLNVFAMAERERFRDSSG